MQATSDELRIELDAASSLPEASQADLLNTAAAKNGVSSS
jgi:hypothetical protein